MRCWLARAVASTGGMSYALGEVEWAAWRTCSRKLRAEERWKWTTKVPASASSQAMSAIMPSIGARAVAPVGKTEGCRSRPQSFSMTWRVLAPSSRMAIQPSDWSVAQPALAIAVGISPNEPVMNHCRSPAHRMRTLLSPVRLRRSGAGRAGRWQTACRKPCRAPPVLAPKPTATTPTGRRSRSSRIAAMFRRPARQARARRLRQVSGRTESQARNLSPSGSTKCGEQISTSTSRPLTGSTARTFSP